MVIIKHQESVISNHVCLCWGYLHESTCQSGITSLEHSSAASQQKGEVRLVSKALREEHVQPIRGPIGHKSQLQCFWEPSVISPTTKISFTAKFNSILQFRLVLTPHTNCHFPPHPLSFVNKEQQPDMYLFEKLASHEVGLMHFLLWGCSEKQKEKVQVCSIPASLPVTTFQVFHY